MAASTGRDSTAMKTLAFLTTLFLPGTFIATLFSTDMVSQQGQGSRPSPPFWQFWAITIPVTILVMIGWRLWWSFEKRQFDKEVSAEVDAAKLPDKVNRPIWHPQ